MSPLRRRLFLLAAAALLPLAIITAFGAWMLVRRQHQEAARAGVELTRALATAVGAELGRSASVVEAVATSPRLDTGDLEGLHVRMMRVQATQPNWDALVLRDPAGAILLDTRVPYGAPLPSPEDPTAVERVRASLAPSVGNLRESSEDDGTRFHFSVDVPVLRDGLLRYVLTALVKPGAIFDILKRQRVPSDWVISIFDTAGQRVARSRRHEETVGKQGAPSVVALMAHPEDEGWGLTNALEGDSIYTAYSRVRGIGWTVATGIPVTLVDGAVWRSALVFGGGFVLSILIGVVVASLIGHSISAPIAALGRSARSLGRREPLTPPTTAIEEIRQVGEALASAAEERTRFEREREELLTREQLARAAAEAANRAKDEFLAMLGHELRNPLGAVANAVALLDHPDVSPEAGARGRQIIARQTAHLARLTDDLLDAGRVITGKIVLERQPLDLAEVAARALGTVDTGRHRMVRALTPAWVHGDVTRLEQIVVNLLGNAIKYTPEGGTIVVEVAREDDMVVLRVRDDGIGMPPGLAARAFELFVQGDRALDRASGGLGIGLTLVHRLAELHGGKATATSAGPGQGSEIVVRLPAIQAPVATPKPPLPPVRPRNGRDVLVVEDNDDVRLALCELLELGGHHVRAAADGVAGLAAALESPPEIALIDVGLPGIDGYELARRIRARENGGRQIKLVALTGYGLPEDRQRALDAGFDLHLVKPVSMAALADLLAS